MAEIPVEIPSYKTSVLKYGRGGEVFTSGVRISQLEKRDFYALIGAGGLSRVPMNDMHPTTYAVEGVEKIVIKPDSLIVRVTDPEAVEQVTEWLKNFMQNNAETRARMEAQLRTPSNRRAGVPEEVEAPLEVKDQFTRDDIPMIVWHMLQTPLSSRMQEVMSLRGYGAPSYGTLSDIPGVNRVEFPKERSIRIGVNSHETHEVVREWIDGLIAIRT